MSICSPSRFFIPKKLRGKLLLNIMMCLLALNTTACNFDVFSGMRSSSAPPPPSGSNNISIDDARNIASPATSGEGFGDTPQINIERSGMNSALGFNTKMLFAENISDEGQRFNRLENAVQKISETVNRMDPTVQRLAKVEQDLEQLTEQLEILLSQDTMTPRVRGNAAKQQPVANNTINLPDVIRTMRVADYGGKTRIVLETSNEMMYTAAMNGNMFSVNYKGAAPNMNLDEVVAKSQFIDSISASADQNETILIFQLIKDSVVLKEGRIPPNKDNSNHRIYIDLRNSSSLVSAKENDEPLVDK